MNAEPSLAGYRLDDAVTALPVVARVDTPTEMAAYFGRVRAHRSELRESVAAVGLALESPIARGGAWREQVRAALAELSHDFADHINLTEPGRNLRPGQAHRAAAVGGGRPVAGRAPRLPRGDRGYLAVLEHGGTLADLPAFREELTTLLGRLVRHRQAGCDLVYEAYEVDLGGSD